MQKNMRTVGTVGTCSNFIDWKTGKQLSLYSQNELKHFVLLRWRDDIDIIEPHVAIPEEELLKIQGSFKQCHMKTSIRKKEFTFLAQLTDGSQEAFCVVPNKNALSNAEIESLWIKKQYCTNKKIKFTILDKGDINETLVRNIRLVTEFYDRSSVFDKTSSVKCLIANKLLKVDMDNKILNFQELIPTIERMLKK